MEDEVKARLRGIHKAVNGDGRGVLERIVVTCTEMLVDRGCSSIAVCHDVPHTSPLVRGRGAHISIDVYLHADDKVGVKYMRQVLTNVDDQKADECDKDADATTKHVVVVSVGGPTPFTRKEFEGTNVQFFLARDVCYNPTRHSLVPKHVVVASPPQGVSKEELPRLLLSDRIVQYHNWPVGTIVYICRSFGGHEPVSYYRVVVASS